MWEQVHSIAEQIDLWTSLGIKCWGVVTAIVLVIARVRRVSIDAFHAIVLSFSIVLLIVITLAAVAIVYLDAVDISHRDISLIGLIMGAMVVIGSIIAWVTVIKTLRIKGL
jgi:hypothetical protein